jgi:hypothetical protein
MTLFVITVIGLISSALLHYLYRNTYIDYERKDGVKVWNKKVVLRRKDFLLCYGINLIPIVNLVVLMALFVNFCMEQNDYDFHFEVKNKFTEWLDKEV